MRQTTTSRRQIGRLVALTLALCFTGSCRREGEPSGVVVAFLDPAGTAAEAGLAAGDTLLAWERAVAPPASPGAARGTFSSCFELTRIEVEEAPRGPLTLTVRRGGRTWPLRLPWLPFGLAVLPASAASPARPACAAYLRGRQAVAAGRLAEAAGAFAEAAAAARALGDPLGEGAARIFEGVAREDGGDLAGSEKALAESLALRRRAAPGSLSEAASWHALGYLFLRRDPARAEAALARALELRERHAPGSQVVAQTLNVLGIFHYYSGDLDRCDESYRRALDILHRLRPGSDDESQVLNNLGLVARERGEPSAAERYFRRSVEILETLAPDGRGYANALYNLGSLASDRGDLLAAESAFRKALVLHEKLAPESWEVATVLANLGLLAETRNDPEAAADFLHRALALQQKIVPGSLEEAMTLNVLGTLALDRRDLPQAERLFRQALAIRRRHAPEGKDTAVSLARLSQVALLRGDLEGAGRTIRQALARRHLARGSRTEADLLAIAGEIAERRGQAAEAGRAYEESLAIVRRLAPQSRLEAEALHRLGSMHGERGELERAEEWLTSAVTAAESQIGRLGAADELRAAAGGSFAELYHDLIATQVRRGRLAAAFHTLERSRGRGLLAALEERDLRYGGGLPAPLLARRRLLAHQYEQTQAAISRLDARQDAERITALLARLAGLRSRRALLAAEIRRAAPRFASLSDPQPLDLAGAAAVLDPGTVYLAWSVGRNESFLFVLGPRAAGTAPPPLEVFTLPLGRDAWTAEVSALQSLILRGRAAPAVEPALVAQGRRLYDLALAPAGGALERADRALLSPDGPLLTLPFAALVRPDRAGEAALFVAAWKPLHTVLSATLYGELARRRRAFPPGAPVVVVADPEVAGESRGARPAGASPTDRFRGGLSPLPGARAEARALAALYGPAVTLLIGPAAGETAVKRLPGTARYLHFACHALLDRRVPLDSALALGGAPPGRRPAEGDDNGLLAAWEIFDLKADADLVTLSACETGLGRDAGGEGLLGLTRAFQYAGARTVAASLWSVADTSTSELMRRFYAGLAAGQAKDEALAGAQQALLRGEAGARFAHPFHWAAFEIIGDRGLPTVGRAASP